MAASTSRADYVFVMEPRPVLRGALVGWLHRTNVWLALVLGYVAAAAFCLGCSPAALLPRVALGAATWWCMWLSDWLHNLDLKMGKEADVKTEFLFWRMDLLSISVILNVQFLLWGSNLGWAVGDWQFIATSLVTLLVAAALFHSGPTVMKNRLRIAPWIKTGYMVQFVLLGWLGYVYVFHTRCGFATSIWFVYLPGFVCFLTKTWLSGRFTHFGPHEWFHTLVYAGHLTSMGIDVYMCTAGSPCAANRVELFRSPDDTASGWTD